MREQPLIDRLASNLAVIRGLVSGVSEEQVRWKPSPEKWSILEVINHLYDEEREDFRKRIDLLLHHPETPWPGIDPEGWVTVRDYMSRDPEESLRNFASEREASIAWLKDLKAVAWEEYKEHPAAGKLAVGDLFASWVAHDFLHMRQLSRLHWEYVSTLAKPFSVRYAGEW